MLCVMAGKVLHLSFTTPFLGNITHHMASEDHGWNLILVNRENYIPADYEVQLTELSNGKKVDSRIYPELQEMFNAARAQGYGLFVREGYRTQEEQQQLMDEKIEAYENEGKPKPEAKKLVPFHPAMLPIFWPISSSRGHAAASTSTRPASAVHHASDSAPASSQSARA